MNGLCQHDMDKLNSSAIALAIRETRGYRTCNDKDELAGFGFRGNQCQIPTMLIPTFNPDGTPGPVMHRPHAPRVNDKGKPVKYEYPKGAPLVLDVPPIDCVREDVRNPAKPLLITEGILKADSAASHGVVCVALPSVWTWIGKNKHGGKMVVSALREIPWCKEKPTRRIPRQVGICFDSDVLCNYGVYQAAQELAGVLERRGASPFFVILPEADDGAKQGLDDYLANGGDPDRLRPEHDDTLWRKELPPCIDSRFPCGSFWGQHRTTAFGLASMIMDSGLWAYRWVPEALAWYEWVGTHWRHSHSDGVTVGYAKVAQYLTRLIDQEPTLEDLLIKAGIDKGQVEELMDGLNPEKGGNPDKGKKCIIKSLGYNPLKWQLLELRNKFENEQFHASVSRFLRQRTETRLSAFDQDPWVINTLSGLVDMRSGDIRPHAPDELVATCIQYHYDPAAPYGDWETFCLRMVGGDREVLRTLQQYVGVAFSGVTAKALAILEGPPNTGKSLFIAMLTSVLGTDLAKSIDANFLAGKLDGSRSAYEQAELQGKRLIYLDETAGEIRFSSDTLKRLTAGKGGMITGRVPGGRPFDFKLQANILICTNDLPRLPSRDQALWNRVLVLPCGESIPEGDQDEGLADRLTKGAPGIIRWAIEGFQDYVANGERFHQAPAIAERVAQYRVDNDIIKQFLDERCCLEDEDSARTPITVVLEAFDDFCAEERIDPRYRLAPRTVRDRIFAALGKKPDTDCRADIGGKRQRCFPGLRLRPDDEPDHEDTLAEVHGLPVGGDDSPGILG